MADIFFMLNELDEEFRKLKESVLGVMRSALRE
jgi:hypothetical protein